MISMEIDPFNGKPWGLHQDFVREAQALWEKYNNENGSSERAFVKVIAAELQRLAQPLARPEGANVHEAGRRLHGIAAAIAVELSGGGTVNMNSLLEKINEVREMLRAPQPRNGAE